LRENRPKGHYINVIEAFKSAGDIAPGFSRKLQDGKLQTAKPKFNRFATSPSFLFEKRTSALTPPVRLFRFGEIQATEL